MSRFSFFTIGSAKAIREARRKENISRVFKAVGAAFDGLVDDIDFVAPEAAIQACDRRRAFRATGDAGLNSPRASVPCPHCGCAVSLQAATTPSSTHRLSEASE
jgi:hypothetical protein